MGGDVVGGTNSEIMRLMKISLRNFKLGRGEHTTLMKHVKYSCVRKRENWQIPSPKNVHVYFFGQWYVWFIRKHRTGN